MGFSSFAIASLLIITSHSFALGAEVDQFTRRDEVLSDSAEIINSKANLSIQKAIATVNLKNQGCQDPAQEAVLYEELREYYSNHFKGKFLKEILNDNSIEKRMIPLKESIFQDWKFWDGIGMGLKLLSKTGLTMSGVVRVGDQTVGTDKFEHMFGQGFNYFTKNYLKEKGEIRAIKRGIFGEKFLLGGNKIGNGVFSYGDLSANFNGMRMWNHMLQLRDDVLGPEHNVGPYIACQNNKWVQVKDIDFKYYIDDSMDESINCSKYPTYKTAEKFSERLAIMGMTCPMDRQKLDNMQVKYGAMAKWMINPDGVGKVKYFKEFKNK